jgi:carbon-monoxide dehydrogenase large subunit
MRNHVGEPLPRREDARLVIGAGWFVAGLRLPACLNAGFIRSDVAHGELRVVRLDSV